MSNSKRKTILDYLRDTTLDEAVITTGNGYNNTIGITRRGMEAIDQLPDSSFPVLFITATRSTRQNLSKICIQAKMQVIIECYVKREGDTNALQSDLDNLIEDVTKALYQDQTLNGNADWLEVLEITTDDSDLAPYGAAGILVEISYNTEGATP